MVDFWGSYSYVEGLFCEIENGFELKLINIVVYKVKFGVMLCYQDWLIVILCLQWIDDMSIGVINCE